MIRCKAGTKFFLEESKFGRNQQWIADIFVIQQILVHKI